MTESPLVDSGFAVLVFSPGDDPIACLNKAMDFLTAGRQGQSYSGTRYKSNATSSRGNNASGQARVVKCYNCQGEGHMAIQCTLPKRPRNAAWYKDKAMLAEAQEDGQILDEEQLAFLADPRIPDGQAIQAIMPNNATFQTEDLNTYDSDCDDISNAKAVLMENISNYGSDVISEVVHIVLWYLDSRCLKHMTRNRSKLINFVSKFLGTVRFRNDHISRIMGYGDYQLGNVTISRVYYVEGLRHNLFSVGHICDADLEVAFWKNTCFIRNLEGVNLLFGSRDTNLYTISLDDMLNIFHLSTIQSVKDKELVMAPSVIISQLWYY
ncbi:integrase, catalytic region, zinc finger, CCHC-type containing protein [Tanacetum coccineum]